MSSSLELTGTLEVIYNTAQVTEKFRKREFVVKVQSGMYPEFIKLQCVQDKCELLDQYKVGDEVTVRFNLKGKPFNGKDGQPVYITNLDAWYIARAGGSSQQAPASSQAAPAAAQTAVSAPPPAMTTDDDLPF